MRMIARFFAAMCLFAFAEGASQAQFYKLHNADFGGSATGQYTTTLTSQDSTAPVPHQSATNSFGGLFTMRDHPFTFAGVEFNYGYTEFTERYVAATYIASTHTDMHEATAAYIVHPHFRNLQPFIGVGGGSVDFVPSRGQNQWRATGLVELGLDVPTSNPHFGFRVQGRSLMYRAPNFKQPNLSSQRFVSSWEPSFGFYLRY